MRSRRLFTRGDDSVIGLSGFAQHFFPPSPLYWTANTFPVLLLYIYQYLLNQRSGNKKKSGQKRREQHDVIFLSEALLSAVPACVCVVSAPFSLSSAGHFWMTGPSFFSIQKYNVLGSNGILYLTGLSNRCDCFFSPRHKLRLGLYQYRRPSKSWRTELVRDVQLGYTSISTAGQHLKGNGW